MDVSNNTKAQRLIDILMKYHRYSNTAMQRCHNGFCQSCQKQPREMIVQAIKKQQPLTLILPAFPAKSANRQKTLSAKPDLGEKMGLANLNLLCQSLQHHHQPGVRLIICSDGRVFNDLVLVSNADVQTYQQGIQQIINQDSLHFLSLFSLDDVYINDDFATMREKLMQDFAEPLEELKQRIRCQSPSLYLFNGIHRFIVEDQLALKPLQSKNQTRLQAKEVTYEVIRRSNAWSKLLATSFPEALRLSIHPQPCGSDKLGIQFLPAKNGWATPWHNVLLKNRDGWQLMKRLDAERLGARLNDDHYVLESDMVFAGEREETGLKSSLFPLGSF